MNLPASNLADIRNTLHECLDRLRVLLAPNRQRLEKVKSLSDLYDAWAQRCHVRPWSEMKPIIREIEQARAAATQASKPFGALGK